MTRAGTSSRSSRDRTARLAARSLCWRSRRRAVRSWYACSPSTDVTDAGLPTFRYHPDPVGSGSFELSPARCPYCGVDRTYVYTGPVYAIDEPDPPCPRCIADGSFAAQFDAEFTDAAALAGLDADI